MKKLQIIRSLRSAGIPSDAFNIEVLKVGRKYRLTVYKPHYAHAILPYTLYARYMTMEKRPLGQPSIFIIEG